MVRYILIKLVALYRILLSPVLGALGCSCRFYPSCSAYAATALRTYPWPQAIALTARRLARCGPWNPGGFDPVTAGVESGTQDTRRFSSSPGAGDKSPSSR